MTNTGPSFEIEAGAVKSWELTPDATPEDGSTAVLRLGRRLPAAAPVSFYQDAHFALLPPFTYSTVYQDDALEIDEGVIDVVLDTTDLGGIEYLWQVDLVSPGGGLIQRWRGVILVTAGLSAL